MWVVSLIRVCRKVNTLLSDIILNTNSLTLDTCNAVMESSTLVVISKFGEDHFVLCPCVCILECICVRIRRYLSVNHPD